MPAEATILVVTSAVPLIVPTLDPGTPSVPQASSPVEYVVQPGDTLSAIAAFHGVSLESLLAANELLDPNFLAVGQVIQLPEPPAVSSAAFKIVPDSRLVRGPGSEAFDVENFIAQQPGYVRDGVDIVEGQVLTAAQIFQRVSLEFSIDPRLLIALVEYRAGWLSNAEPSEERRIRPLGAEPSLLGFDRDGLYRQLSWAADQLNAGYYGWKYRSLNAVEFEDGTRIGFAAGLNAGTIAMQYMLSQFNTYGIWTRDIGPEGFYHMYVRLFGDPFVDSIDPLVPGGIQQPPLALPFESGEVWFYTGGPHGGWGSGSAWSAIDFAPPDDLTDVETACYVSQYWATSVAPGVIVRSGNGVVVLDLDRDSNEATGWSILYLHMASDGRIEEETVVEAGQRLGRPSCEGGFSNGTHMHLARRYNGEWLPADCGACPPENAIPPFVLGNWTVVAIPGQEYQGFLVNGTEERIAEQGRLTSVNLIAW